MNEIATYSTTEEFKSSAVAPNGNNAHSADAVNSGGSKSTTRRVGGPPS